MPISFYIILIVCLGLLIWPRHGDTKPSMPYSKSIDDWIFLERKPDENFSMDKYTEDETPTDIVRY